MSKREIIKTNNNIKGNCFIGNKNKSNLYFYLKDRKKTIIKGNKKSDIKIFNINNYISYINITKLIIIMNLLIQILSFKKLYLIKFNFSKITLKIKGTGYKDVFCKTTFNFGKDYYPNLIYINGDFQNIINHTYNFIQSDNNFVELIWNKNVYNCRFMFFGCSDITYIDLSNFNSSQVVTMSYMFSGCSSLTSLNLANFDTSQVNIMNYMFNGCSSLKSLNLSSFDNSQIIEMYSMFCGCSSLLSLNLTNFNTSLVTDVRFMFDGCVSLSYVNLFNFNQTKLRYQTNMFRDVPNNIVLCLNNKNNNDKILNQLDDKSCYIKDCSSDWKSKQKKIISDSNDCIDKCEDDPIYKYEFNGKCYETQINDEKSDTINEQQCEYSKCLTCSKESISYNLCLKCNNNYYPKENDITNIKEYINCYEKINGYYLDKIDFIFKKCYYSCETCEIKGDNMTHNCLKCKSNFNSSVKINNYSNCYENIDNSYDINEYKSNSIINKETQEMIESEKFENYSKIINEKELYVSILQKFESIFTSENYNTSKIDNGEDEINEFGRFIITFSSTDNQKNNLYKNMTSLNFDQCETLIRDYYNLTNNQTLYMEKVDIIQEKMKIPKVIYGIYSKLNGTNLIKLNLSICEEKKISLIVPVALNESIDILNSSSEYYRDICYKSTSTSGTDMIINDRKIGFVENNKTVCQEYCTLYNYNYDEKKANCSCLIKESYSIGDNMDINKTKLYENFADIKNKKTLSNLDITSCNVLSSKENIESNSGFYLLLFILVAFIIIFIIIYSKGYQLLESTIDKVIYDKFKNETKQGKIKKFIKEGKILPFKKGKKHKNNDQKIQNKKSLIKSNNNTNNLFMKKNQNKKLGSKYKASKFENKENKNIILEFHKIKPDTDYEFNWLSYKEALKYDKRSNCEYYNSLIKTKQLFIFTFCSINDYNSGVVKKFIAFLSFALHYTVNALFFDDSNMHQIYEDEGKYNFEYQLPYIIYSVIISNLILRLILQFLVLTDKDVFQVKLQQNRIMAIHGKNKKLKIIKIKFAIFFILNFILLILFWYYLTYFNAIYQNTQIYLIENTFISFGLSLFYPFIINIIPMVIRRCSMNSTNQEYAYKVSQIIQLI